MMQVKTRFISHKVIAVHAVWKTVCFLVLHFMKISKRE